MVSVVRDSHIVLTVPYQQIITYLFSGKNPQHIIKAFHAEYINVFIFHGLECGFEGKYASQKFLLDGKFYRRKSPRHLTYAAVQSQFSHYHEFFQQRQFSLA